MLIQLLVPNWYNRQIVKLSPFVKNSYYGDYDNNIFGYCWTLINFFLSISMKMNEMHLKSREAHIVTLHKVTRNDSWREKGRYNYFLHYIIIIERFCNYPLIRFNKSNASTRVRNHALKKYRKYFNQSYINANYLVCIPKYSVNYKLYKMGSIRYKNIKSCSESWKLIIV